MTTTQPAQRIQIGPSIPDAYQGMVSLNGVVERAAADAGVEKTLIELVKIRASQLNGCAYCLDMHTADAIGAGEDPRRVFVLDGWREAGLFTGQECAGLELTEVLTRLSTTQGVPEDLYQRATAVFTEDQYGAVVWMIVMINSWNRIALASHAALPPK